MRSRSKYLTILCLAGLLLLGGFGRQASAGTPEVPVNQAAEPSASPTPKPAEPERVVVQHILVSFADLSFALPPGEIGMCDFDPKRSPYGWHISKRIK
jgi:hypothetical protein